MQMKNKIQHTMRQLHQDKEVIWEKKKNKKKKPNNILLQFQSIVGQALIDWSTPLAPIKIIWNIEDMRLMLNAFSSTTVDEQAGSWSRCPFFQRITRTNAPHRLSEFCNARSTSQFSLRPKHVDQTFFEISQSRCVNKEMKVRQQNHICMYTLRLSEEI